MIKLIVYGTLAFVVGFAARAIVANSSNEVT
jgi:hypothetical protein